MDTPQSLKRQIARLQSDLRVAGDYRERALSAEKVTRELRTDLHRVRRELNELEEHEAAITRAGSLRFKPFTIEVERHTAHSPGHPMGTWSDWHGGETVRRSDVGGINAYNRRIMHARVEKLVSSTINLLRNYGGKKPEYPGFWLNLGGDMLSGKIHEELRETNWGTVEEQALEVGGLISGGMLKIADEFADGKTKFVDVACVVGNHGRNSIRPVWKNKVRENREYGVYKSLERQFANDERFRFHIPEDTDFLFKIYGTRFLLTHGDALGTKGGDGIIGAIGPITRGIVKVGTAERVFGRDFDYMIMGHWHSCQPAGALFRAIVNGTLKGADEFALRGLRVASSPPSQHLCLVSPKHGLGAQWAVEV